MLGPSLRESGLNRRSLLKTLAVGGAAATAAFYGFLPKAFADALAWPADAFKQKSEADALKALFGKTAEESDKVKLDTPEIAENGAVVPVSVSADMPDVTSIAIFVEENPFTLAAMYKLPAGTAPSVSNRLKMAKTTKVVAVVEAGGKLYSANKEVKVTVGGCGG